MAQITLTFENYEEMIDFSQRILSVENDKPQQKENTSVAEQQASTPYGQQIAHHFPQANTSVQAAPQEVTPGTSVPTTAPSYTREDLSKAAMQLMDKGMQMQLQQLIQSYGVASLVDLPPEQYGNFATAIRGMGAQI